MINGFSSIELRAVLEERSGITWGAEQERQNPEPDALPVLTVTNVQETLRTEPILYLRGVSERDRERKAAKKGWTIAVGSNGNRKRIGNCVFIDKDTEYLFASFLVAFRPKPDSEIEPEYFFRWLSSYEVQERLSASAEGTTGLGNLSTRYLRTLCISYPTELQEQTRVVEILRFVDSAIAATRESIAKAERLQKGLMQQLLTGRMKPDGTRRSKDEFQETKFGLLPRDWTAVRVKEFGEVSTGKTPPTANEEHFCGDFQFITPGDMGEKKWIRHTERSLSAAGSEHAGVLPANAVCAVCIGATIGKIGLTTRPACTNQQINSVVCSEEHSPEYFYYALRFRARHLLAIAGVNATPQLNKSDFSKYRVPMPTNIDEEQAIGEKLAGFDDLIEAMRTKIAALQRLKKSLMQNLLTGRIRLPVDFGGVKEEA
jgi:type I restriction enzyme S subunit